MGMLQRLKSELFMDSSILISTYFTSVLMLTPPIMTSIYTEKFTYQAARRLVTGASCVCVWRGGGAPITRRTLILNTVKVAHRNRH